MKHIRPYWCLGFLTLLTLAGCGSSGSLKQDNLQAIAQEFTLGPEDVIEVYVWKNEHLSRKVPVRPDGKVSLPLVNDVQAAGLTPMQLRVVLAKKYAAYIPDVEISVIVQEVHSPKVSVLGKVAHPGRLELKGPTTLLEILAFAGGTTEFASRSHVFVVRSDGNKTEKFRVDHGRMMANVYLHSGDIVVVP